MMIMFFLNIDVINFSSQITNSLSIISSRTMSDDYDVWEQVFFITISSIITTTAEKFLYFRIKITFYLIAIILILLFFRHSSKERKKNELSKFEGLN